LSAPLSSWEENFLPQKGEIAVGRNKKEVPFPARNEVCSSMVEANAPRAASTGNPEN